MSEDLVQFRTASLTQRAMASSLLPVEEWVTADCVEAGERHDDRAAMLLLQQEEALFDVVEGAAEFGPETPSRPATRPRQPGHRLRWS